VQREQHEEEQDAQFTPAESSSRRRPKWVERTLREAQEQVEAPQTSVRMSRAPQRFSSYMALMSELIEAEPSSFQEASEQQVWRDAMMEEYSSIMKNDVWEVVPRPEGKSVVGSRWIYKIKHALMGVWTSSKPALWLRASHRRKALTSVRHLHPWRDILLSGP
jgi:hypothetical protein